MKKNKNNKNMKAKTKKKSSNSLKKTIEIKKDENKIGIVPLGDRVLVKPFEIEAETQTASGIIIPDTVSKEKPEQGEIVAVGDGKWIDGKKVLLNVKIGDKVVFSRYGYEDVKVNGVEYYILKEENILAIIK